MKTLKPITGRVNHADITAAINTLRGVVEPDTEKHMIYDAVYSHFHEAKAELFPQLPYMVTETRAFPLFNDFWSETLWTIAEYRGEHGESIKFTREGTTMVDYTAEVWEI